MRERSIDVEHKLQEEYMRSYKFLDYSKYSLTLLFIRKRERRNTGQVGSPFPLEIDPPIDQAGDPNSVKSQS